MHKQPEMPKSPEQILAEKKEKLTQDINLMLDWQRVERIKEKLLPRLDEFTSEEIDYYLRLVYYLDNQVQLSGPLANVASEQLIKDGGELKRLEEIIGQERAEELKKLVE